MIEGPLNPRPSPSPGEGLSQSDGTDTRDIETKEFASYSLTPNPKL